MSSSPRIPLPITTPLVGIERTITRRYTFRLGSPSGFKVPTQ